MKVAILIEPLATGGYVARAGEPFAASAEGATAEEAALRLESVLRTRLASGGRVALIDLPNGAGEPAPLADEGWFFDTLCDEIEKNRRQEDEAAG